MTDKHVYHQMFMEWESVITYGNQSFERYETINALFHYHNAINIAETLLMIHPESRQSIGALLVSYHNLSDFYEREGAFNMAWHTLSFIEGKMQEHRQRFQRCEAVLWGYGVARKQKLLFEKHHITNVVAGITGTSVTQYKSEYYPHSYH